jgi:2-polyprenyl-3-methyl-5-hydroxy-6-metoxy-1,4-benzoquinol methylase
VNTSDFFSQEAAQWEAHYASDARFQRRYERITKFLGRVLPQAGRALDVGCGSGIFSRYLASHRWRVKAIDLSPKMIETARSISDANIEFEVARIEDLASNEQFDAIVAFSMLEYVEEDDVAIQKFADMLPNGGVLVISVPNRVGLLRRVEGIIYSIRLATREMLFAGRGEYLKHQKRQYSPFELDMMMRGVGLRKKRAIYLNAGVAGPAWLLPLLERRWFAALYCAAYEKK